MPEPARLPSKIFSGYFLFLSSGIDIFPTVATVAAEDPDIAAKKAVEWNIEKKRSDLKTKKEEIEKINKSKLFLELKNNFSDIKLVDVKNKDD